MPKTEQEILADTLKSPEQGGSAQTGGALGAGADVPAVLESQPATKQLLEESIKIQSGKNSPTFQSAAITSDQAAEAVDQQASDVQKDLATTSQLQEIYTPKYQEYGDSSSQIDQSRIDTKNTFENLKSAISTDFAQRQLDQETANAQQTGFQTKQLARMKAFGTSASGLGFLKQVEIQNQQEINKLLSLKSQALIAATQAYQSQDWTMLTAQIDNAQKMTDQYNNIQSQMLEDSLKTNNQLMEQSRFGWETEDRAAGKIAEIISSGIAFDQIDSTEVSTLEETAGVPSGYFSSLWTLNNKMTEQVDIATDLEMQTGIADLLDKTPDGMTVKIGDAYYTGRKIKDATQNKWQGTFEDAQGNSSMLIYDYATETMQKIPLGNTGKLDDGWSLEDINGEKYRINTKTGTVEAVVLKGSEMNPENLPGFTDWSASIGTMTTHFGDSTNYEGSHPGVDIAGAYGTSITAFVGGQVTKIDDSGTSGFGNYVEVTDSDGRVHRYSHLSGINVALGQTINARQSIGAMGNTGNVLTQQPDGSYSEPTPEQRAAGKGSHLDYRVFTEDKQLGTNTVGNISQISQKALDIIFGSEKFTQDQKQSIQTAITTGEDPFTVVKNQAKNIMGQTQATSLDKYETAKTQMISIQNLLNDFYKNNGKTDIFKGTYEKVYNKLGEVNDPKLVGIATNIAAALQIYRNAVSGTAYSEQEGKDIASIFPGINKTEGLNKAIVNARLQAFDTTIDGTYRNTLGNVYDELKANEIANETLLTPLNQTYSTLDDLVRDNPDYYSLIGQIEQQYPNASDEEILGLINSLY